MGDAVRELTEFNVVQMLREIKNVQVGVEFNRDWLSPLQLTRIEVAAEALQQAARRAKAERC